jgi:hypothetical protein
MAAYVPVAPDVVDLVSQREKRPSKAVALAGPLGTWPIGKKGPKPISVPGVSRPVEVKIASERGEWEQAYRLVAANYRACGYEPPDCSPMRFTNFHVLPDTTTFVAKHDDNVLATLTLVQDNYLLGLPMESIYTAEIEELRQARQRIVEVTNLADTELTLREFVPVFVGLMRLMTQYALRQEADTLVISVNPRHRTFYRKMMGFVPLGPWRAYPTVQNHPAEAYLLNVTLLRDNAPAMYETILGELLPDEALTARRMPTQLVRYFGRNSSHTDPEGVDNILQYVETFGSPCRWAGGERVSR